MESLEETIRIINELNTEDVDTFALLLDGKIVWCDTERITPAIFFRHDAIEVFKRALAHKNNEGKNFSIRPVKISIL